MNFSVDIFRNSTSGYSQYPHDNSDELLKNIAANASSQSQLVVHRDNDLIHYVYVRKFKEGAEYIGFSLLFNGVVLNRVEELFNIFENAIADLVARSEILQLNKNGEILIKPRRLHHVSEECERILQIIKNDVEKLEHSFNKLPAQKYDKSKTERKELSLNADKNEIYKACCEYPNTIILKSSDCDAPSLSHYRGIINGLNNEKNQLTKDLRELTAKYNELNRKKKNYEKVAILAFILVIGVFSFFALYNSYGRAMNEIDNANKEIYIKNKNISTLETKVSNLQKSLNTEQSKRIDAENDLSEFKTTTGNYMPIIISDVKIGNAYNGGSIETDYGETIYSNSTMYLKPKITYRGINTGENIEIKVKLFCPNGKISEGNNSDYTYSYSFIVKSGTNSQAFSGWGNSTMGNWESGKYRFEFWYKDVCLKAKTFTIY